MAKLVKMMLTMNSAIQRLISIPGRNQVRQALRVIPPLFPDRRA